MGFDEGEKMGAWVFGVLTLSRPIHSKYWFSSQLYPDPSSGNLSGLFHGEVVKLSLGKYPRCLVFCGFLCDLASRKCP